MAYKRYISPMGGSYEVGPEGRISTRDKRVVVMLSFDEFIEVTAAAHDGMTSVSSWCRNLILTALDQLDKQRASLKAVKQRYGIKDDDDPFTPTITVDRKGRTRSGHGDSFDGDNGVVDLDKRPMPGDGLGNLLSDFDVDGEGE